MNEKHLTYFKVENFKRFESFEMANIGQFNLILGDNNVGKTSVLEALLFDENADRFAENLLTVLFEFRKVSQGTGKPLTIFSKKGQFNLEIQYQGNANKINIHVTLYDIPALNGIALKLLNLDNNAQTAKQKIPYIPFHVGYDQDLVTYFTKYIEPDRKIEKGLIDALKYIIPNIEIIKTPNNERNIPFLLIGVSDKDDRIPLSMFGEGAIKLFRILAKIVVHKGQRLMIDEIDAGLHFKNMKTFWRVILLAAKQNEVQIFAATHNIECLQAFKEVLQEEGQGFQDKARTITLYETTNKQVQARTRNFEAFQEAIDEGYNIRGGE